MSLSKGRCAVDGRQWFATSSDWSSPSSLHCTCSPNTFDREYLGRHIKLLMSSCNWTSPWQWSQAHQRLGLIQSVFVAVQGQKRRLSGERERDKGKKGVWLPGSAGKLSSGKLAVDQHKDCCRQEIFYTCNFILNLFIFFKINQIWTKLVYD